jgi:hypothetical protein
MPKSFVVNIKNEFYIAIANKGMHCFLMLGVVKDDGSHQLLARVGKSNNLDPDFYNHCRMMQKAICGSGTIAIISDEGIFKPKTKQIFISYQAYTISKEQAIEFLVLINDIEIQQLENPTVRASWNKYKTDENRIQCYIPTVDKAQQTINFEFKSLNSWANGISSKGKYHNRNNLFKDAQTLHTSNTCRTTALRILESVLGFKTGVSESFYIAPKYRTTLLAGQPLSSSFYILPPPPEAFFKTLSPSQLDVLQQLYKRLAVLPLSKINDIKTRAKFMELKAMYLDIAGYCNLSAVDVLVSILAHEAAHRKELYAVRSPNIISRFFSIKSTTEHMLTQLKQKLSHEAGPQSSFVSC